MNEEKDISLIDRYLRNELNQEERIAFDNRRQSDVKFDDLVYDLEAIQRVSREESLKKTLRHFESLEKSNSRKIIGMNRWMAAAATLILLVVAAFGWQEWKERSRVDGIMASYEHVMSDVLTRGDDDVNDRKKAYVLYEARRYEQAIPFFENILEQGRRSDSIFYGLNLLHAREFEMAEEVLRGISKGEEQEVIDDGLKIINEIKK